MSLIMGARNPMNSWDKSDSKIQDGKFCMGENDLSLLKRLSLAGKDHRKFMRMITVYVDITAPFYYFKEFETYKIGTTCNSCSTMHKLTSKSFELKDFSCDHLNTQSVMVLDNIILYLNQLRELYLKNKDKNVWWQMIQLLPNSYNQKRTIMLNYEVLANMYHSRNTHKLDEWKEFCKWVETLPYCNELIKPERIDIA